MIIIRVVKYEISELVNTNTKVETVTGETRKTCRKN